MSKNKLYQISSYGALSSGHFDGRSPLSVVLNEGSNGIGTLDGANGELIIVSGKVFHADDKGQISQPVLDNKTPYTAVFDQKNGQTFESLDTLSNLTELHTVIGHGNFSHVKVGNKPKQTKPYRQTFQEILAGQPQFTTEDISGTLVGIYSPDSYADLTGHGWHLHFISDDEKFGGHVLEFEAGSVKFDVARVDRLVQDF